MWVVFFGCVPGGGGPEGVADTGPPELSDAAAHLPVAGPPSWTAAEVEEKLVMSLALGLPDPRTIHAHFLDAMAGADARCPARLGTLGFAMPQSSCTSEAGYFYYGVAELLPDADGLAETDDWKMGTCSFDIGFPDGERFTCGGTFGYSRTATEGGATFVAFDDATVAWDGGPAWSGAGTGSAYTVTGSVAGEHAAFELMGGLLAADTAVFFDAFAYDDTMCDGLPTLAVRLRDDNAYWYTATVGAECDPCGTLSYAGEELGTVCVDGTEAAEGLAASLGAP